MPMLLIVLLFLAVFAPHAVHAQQALSMRFDVRYGPLRAARISLDAELDAHSYRVRGRVESSGIVGLIRDFHFDLATDGTRDGDLYAPARYVGDSDTGWHETRVEIRYPGGVPTVLTLLPNEPVTDWTLNPATQTGTLDPLTALLILIQPAARADLCGRAVETFDGRRRARLSLAAPVADGPDLVCAGVYQRLAGFPPEDMADYDRLHFTLVFEPGGGDEWRLVRAVTQTPYGRMRLVSPD